MKIKPLIAALSLATMATLPSLSYAQVAGSTTLGVSATEITQIASGWSVKKSILGKTV